MHKSIYSFNLLLLIGLLGNSYIFTFIHTLMNLGKLPKMLLNFWFIVFGMDKLTWYKFKKNLLFFHNFGLQLIFVLCWNICTGIRIRFLLDFRQFNNLVFICTMRATAPAAAIITHHRWKWIGNSSSQTFFFVCFMLHNILTTSMNWFS